MRCVDLTHPLHTGSPVFPGSDPPRFERVATLKDAGHAETRILMHTHTGTRRPTCSRAVRPWTSTIRRHFWVLPSSSMSPGTSALRSIHHTLMEAGALIIESLTRLESIQPSGAHFACFPLAIEAADGCPVRAVAIEER